MTKTEAKWRALIAEQEKSGLKVREFAAQRGIAAGTLYWWRSKLQRDATELREATELVPVDVVERSTVAGDRSDTAFELRVNDSMTLQIHAGFDEAELRRLLRALQC